jgi:hypothetical protein
MPLSFMPPKGAVSPGGFRRDDALVDADDAVFERLGDAPDAADVAAVEIGSEPAPFPPPQTGEGRVGVSLAILIRKKPPAPIVHPLFRLFYQVEIRHRQLLQKQKPRSRGADLATIRCDYGDSIVAECTIPSAGWRQSHG